MPATSFLPGILLGLHPPPGEHSRGISSSQFFPPVRAGSPLFKQVVGSRPSTAGLCPVNSRGPFRLPPRPPVRASISPLVHASHPAQGAPTPHSTTTACRPSQAHPAPHRWLTQLFTLVITHHFPNLLLISTKTTHLSPPHMCLLIRGSRQCGPL